MTAHDHAGELARYGMCLTCAEQGLPTAREPEPAGALPLPETLDFDGDGISPADHLRLGAQARRVLDVVADGQWRTLAELASATGDPESSVSARLRDLRKPKFGGYGIDRRLRSPGLHEYRLTQPEPESVR